MPIDNSFPSAYNSDDGSEHEGAAANFTEDAVQYSTHREDGYSSYRMGNTGANKDGSQNNIRFKQQVDTHNSVMYR